MGLRAFAWQGFSLVYGMFGLVVMTVVAAARDRAFNDHPTPEETKELEIAQKKYWDLSQSPLPGFRHEFFHRENGGKLHYVVKDGEGESRKNVIIFIHGFPDSYLLWRRLLSSSALLPYTLIAVDLPGYGGSDSLAKYDANNVLEAVTGFILGMREKYLGDEGRLVMVTHDWGGIVGARLASEAHQLADRWVIASAAIPKLVQSNVYAHLASARLMVRTFLHHPLNPRPLRSAISTLQPVFTQLLRSFYVFILNLPAPLSSTFATMGNYWFLRLMHKIQAGILNASNSKMTGSASPKQKADYLAMSSGPGRSVLSTSTRLPEAMGYGESVKRRTNHGMWDKIQMYRDNLILSQWEKSLETVVSLSEIPMNAGRSDSGTGLGLFDDGPQGALKAPTTIVYGKEDAAFDIPLGTAGIADYVVKGSHVLVVEGANHWLPFEAKGAHVLETVTAWAIGGPDGPLAEKVKQMQGVSTLVQK